MSNDAGLILGVSDEASASPHRCRGPGLVRHQGRGGDRAEQAGLGPGLRGHPQAAVLRWRARPQHLHAAAPRPLAGGDPEEAGGG